MAYDPALLARFQETFNSQPRNMPPEYESQRLIWHLCHLCNLTTSSISAYLSLVALSHNTNIEGALSGVYFAYPPAMRAQAAMLADAAQNLERTKGTLTGMPEHVPLLKQHPSYRSLIDAANKIKDIVRIIPQTSPPVFAGGVLEEACMPKKEGTEQVRAAYDELTELCDGNPQKGIVGWKKCWHDINKQLGAKY